jgi:hypothetical protein
MSWANLDDRLHAHPKVVTPPLRPCGNPRCHLCNPRHYPVRNEGEEPLASLFLGAAAIVLLLVFAFVLLPVMVA